MKKNYETPAIEIYVLRDDPLADGSGSPAPLDFTVGTDGFIKGAY